MKRTSIHFGTQAINAALKQAGLTNAQMSEELCVNEKTWYRWKRSGAIPGGRVTDVVLLLPLPEPADLPAEVPRIAWAVRRDFEQMAGAMSDRLQRIEEHLGIGPPDVPRPG